jgi:4-carboxymuconolactone decarboxylase
VLGLFAHHPELAKAFLTFNGHLLWATSLTPRQREIVVLRVAALRTCAYLWSQHVFEARDAGLTEEEIGRIAFGPDAPFFSALEAAIVRAVDELLGEGAVAAATWEVLTAELDERQLLDLVFTAGCYDTTSWLYNTVGLEPDPGIEEMYARYQAPPEEPG